MLDNKTFEQRKLNTRKKVVVYAQVSHLLTTRKFQTWLFSNSSRFIIDSLVIQDFIKVSI